MAVEMFLKLTDCKGEATAQGFTDEIDVLGWTWGATNTGTAHLGGGAGTGKANFHDLTVTKYVDLSSATIMENCAKGKHFTTATLTCRKVGGDQPLKYLTITMNEVFVSGIHFGGSTGDERTTENVTLNFESFKKQYFLQSAQGSNSGDSDFSWDIKKNAKA